MPVENENRDEHGFIELHGKFYLLGGSGDLKATMEYNPSKNSWRALDEPMPKNFNHFQAVTYKNRIWIICAWMGQYPNERNVTHVWSLDPNAEGGKGKWYRGTEIPKNRRRGSAGVILYENKFYIVNGLSNGHSAPDRGNRFLDVYDPNGNNGKGIWQVLPDAPRTRDHFHAARVEDKIYVIGGRNNLWTGKGEFSDIVKKVDVYDMSRNVWLKDVQTPPDIPTPRSGSTVLTIGDEIIVLGGVGNHRDQEFRVLEALNVASNRWRTLPPMNVKRSGTQAIFFSRKIWIVSGEASAGEKTKNFEFSSWKDLSEAS